MTEFEKEYHDFVLDYISNQKKRRMSYKVEVDFWEAPEDGEHVHGWYGMTFSQEQLDEITAILQRAEQNDLTVEEVVMDGHEQLREYIYEKVSFALPHLEAVGFGEEPIITDFDLTPIPYYQFHAIVVDGEKEDSKVLYRIPIAVSLEDEEYVSLLIERWNHHLWNHPFTMNILLETNPSLCRKINRCFLPIEYDLHFCYHEQRFPYVIVFSEMEEDFEIIQSLWKKKVEKNSR